MNITNKSDEEIYDIITRHQQKRHDVFYIEIKNLL